MKTDGVAISVKGVSKNFRLPHQKADSIKSLFVNPFSLFNGSKDVEVQHALRDISFDIKKGRFFGVVGRNGSGKSTMLKILAGIYRPTEGSVHVEGKLVPFIELGVGFNPELTGRENVYLSAALNGFSEDEVDGMYDDIVQFAELEQFMDQKLKNYSSGMQVRLAFSVATRSKADILLIDEVLAVGDADFQRKCFEYFKHLKKIKKTVVFVSHDMDAVKEYCDTALLIEEGKIAYMGDVDMVTQKYRMLFNVDGDVMQDAVNSDNERWGNREAYFSSIDTKMTSKTITLLQEIIINADMDEAPVVGYRIRSSDGDDIMGTNTKIESVKMGSLKKGDRVSLQWSIPNILSDGKYSIDPAILSSNGMTVYDWWNQAGVLQVRKDRFIPYDVDVSVDVKLKKY
jgi:ABC-2 type transport system ATP-binding protein